MIQINEIKKKSVGCMSIFHRNENVLYVRRLVTYVVTFEKPLGSEKNIQCTQRIMLVFDRSFWVNKPEGDLMSN